MAKKVFISLFVIFIFLFSGIACEKGPNMKEGLWEITISMEIPDMPMQMPSQTYTQCITKKNIVPQREETNQECKTIKHDVKGDTVSWIIECKTSEGTTVSNGNVTYKGDMFDGIVKVSILGGKGGDMEMTQKMSGKWIGQCK